MIRSAVLKQITGATSNSYGPDSDGPGFDASGFDGSLHIALTIVQYQRARIQQLQCNCTAYSNSYIPRTIWDWNALDVDPLHCQSADSFRHHLNWTQPVHHCRHHCWMAGNVVTQPRCVSPLMRLHLLRRRRSNQQMSMNIAGLCVSCWYNIKHHFYWKMYYILRKSRRTNKRQYITLP